MMNQMYSVSIGSPTVICQWIGPACAAKQGIKTQTTKEHLRGAPSPATEQNLRCRLTEVDLTHLVYFLLKKTVQDVLFQIG